MPRYNINDFNSEDANQRHQEDINKEDDSFHLRNSETLSNQQNNSSVTPNEDTLRPEPGNEDDFNNIGDGISEDIQNSVKSLAIASPGVASPKAFPISKNLPSAFCIKNT